jgi:hypothetical protein
MPGKELLMPSLAKPPLWFWVLAGLLALWGGMGVAGYHVDLATSPADRAGLDAYDRQLYATRPAWFMLCYGLAVWSGLLGSLLLLARRRFARPLFLVSLAAVVVMFGWMFVATDIIAHKGVLVATGFPVVIALLCLLEIWFAGLAQRRRWIG